MARYALNVLISIDQLFASLVGGYPDETLSSYAHRLHAQGKFFGFTRDWINAIFFWQEDHCHLAYTAERARVQLPPALRDL